MRALFLWTALMLTAVGCAPVDYGREAQRAGQFQGRVMVFWLGEGDRKAGDGLFIYVPARKDPLIFHWQDGEGRQRVTQPGIMFTDGGSIPRFAQGIKGLSPWGYAPAYMVHDWAFELHHCLVDKNPNSQQIGQEDTDFTNSARLMAQALAALVKEGRVRAESRAPRLVTLAVSSPIARAKWDKVGMCTNSPEFERISREYDEMANGAGARTAIARLSARQGAAPQLIGVINFGN